MEEIYVEQTSPKTIFKYVLIILFFLGIVIGGYIYFHQNNILRVKNVVIELGEKLPDDIEFYLQNKVNNIKDYSLNLIAVPVDEDGKTDIVGTYKYTIKFNNQKKTGKIIVKDTKAPLAVLNKLTIGVSEEFNLNDFIKECDDLSLPCDAKLNNKKDKAIFSKVGNHIIEIKVSDKYGNSIVKETEVVVSDKITLLEEKKKDFNIARISPQYDDFNGNITLKYESAVSEDLLDESIEYEDYLELVSTDYSDFSDKEILEQEIITLYNKYDYIIGFTVKLIYSDGTIEYVGE